MIIRRLKAETTTTKEKYEHRSTQQNNNKILEEIIKSQRSHSDKSGLGFNSKGANKRVDFKVSEDNHKSYANTLINSHHSQHHKSMNTRMQPTNERTPEVPENQNLRNNWRQQPNIRSAPRFSNRYQTFFPGYCYLCYNFWHKAFNCRTYQKRVFSWKKKESESVKQ